MNLICLGLHARWQIQYHSNRGDSFIYLSAETLWFISIFFPIPLVFVCIKCEWNFLWLLNKFSLCAFKMKCYLCVSQCLIFVRSFRYWLEILYLFKNYFLNCSQTVKRMYGYKLSEFQNSLWFKLKCVFLFWILGCDQSFINWNVCCYTVE